MSGLFDEKYANVRDEWDDEQPVRLVEPRAPAAWLGSVCVWGPAQTQGSKRGFVHPQLKRVVIVDDNDKALKGWRQELIDAMVRHKPVTPLDKAVAVLIRLYVPRPQAHYRTGAAAGELKVNAPALPASGRDIDKVARAVLDAMQIARWVVNDARVADLHIQRRYDDGIGERSWAWCWAVDAPDQQQPELDEAIDVGEDDDGRWDEYR